VAGLLEFISAVQPVPVVLLRCDISAVGAVAHRAFAGFVGWSAHTRHGPLPMRQPDRAEDRDQSPSVFVPALHEYFKASSLPAFARVGRLDVLRCSDSICGDSACGDSACGDSACGGDSLLAIADLGEVDLRASRLLASRHNVAATEQLAGRIFAAAEPRDAWQETCQAGAQAGASLAEHGISLALKPWLRQWLQPSGKPAPVGLLLQ
jgi:hypothetical protein